MTFRAVEPVRVGQGFSAKYPNPPAQCQNPECENAPHDAHHAIPAGLGGKRYEVFEIDGVQRNCVIWLCRLCHHDITVNKARIVWDDGEWCWNDYGNSLDPVLDTALPPSSPPEDPVSPPVVVGERSVEHRTGLRISPGAGVTIRRDDVGRTDTGEAFVPGLPGPPAGTGTDAIDGVETASRVPGPGEKCPTCDRRVNHPAKKESPKDLKQLNLGPGPADTVQRLRERLDDVAESAGLSEMPFHRVRMLDLMLVLVESVNVDTLRGMVDELPWAA